MAFMLCCFAQTGAASDFSTLYDIDGDSNMDIGDLNVIINTMLHRSDLPTAAWPRVWGLSAQASDVNGDGTVDVDDINVFINMMLKKPSQNAGAAAEADGIFRQCYNVLAYGGPNGANGGCYVDGVDSGTSDFVRQLWNANELTTDEAICCWGDDGIPQFNFNTWNSSHPMLAGFFYRLYAAIRYHNYYLQHYGGIDAMRTAEVRLLRALAYYHLMDMWGNVPFLLSAMSMMPPKQASRAELFDFIESELLAIHDQLHTPVAQKYGQSGGDWGWGRVDQDACNLLLARLYLNAEVYTGEKRYAEAARYAKMVIDGPHKLHTASKTVSVSDGVASRDYTFSAYRTLFMGDNNVTGAATEAILPFHYDGGETLLTTWGSRTFLIASTFDWEMHESVLGGDATNGTNQTWGGNRARPELIRLFFPNSNVPVGNSWKVAPAASDDRALFNTVGRSMNVDYWNMFKYGFAVAKYVNFKTTPNVSGTGFVSGDNPTFPDGDFFLMRSAEAYLTYAEALTREVGSADNTPVTGAALEAVKAIRDRAHAANVASFTLSDLLDEWGREFYYEGRRRMDLIRFGRYGGDTDYLWQWKGGPPAGRQFTASRNVFALPARVLEENSELVQNVGYGDDYDFNGSSLHFDTPAEALGVVNIAASDNPVLQLSCQASWPEDRALYTLLVSRNADMSESSVVFSNATKSYLVCTGRQLYEILKNYWYDFQLSENVTTNVFPLYLQLKAACVGSDVLFNGTERSSNVVVLPRVSLTLTPESGGSLPEPMYILGNCVGRGSFVNHRTMGLYTSTVMMYPNPWNSRQLVYASYFCDNAQFKIILQPGNKENVIGADVYGNIIYQESTPEGGTTPGNITIANGGYYVIIVDVDTKKLTIQHLTKSTNCYNTMSVGHTTTNSDGMDKATVVNMAPITTISLGENHDWWIADASFADGYAWLLAGDTEAHTGTWWPHGVAKWQSSDRGQWCFGADNGIPVEAGNYRVFYNDLLNIYYFMLK